MLRMTKLLKWACKVDGLIAPFHMFLTKRNAILYCGSTIFASLQSRLTSRMRAPIKSIGLFAKTTQDSIVFKFFSDTFENSSIVETVHDSMAI
jgi:hypothetical protein